MAQPASPRLALRLIHSALALTPLVAGAVFFAVLQRRPAPLAGEWLPLAAAGCGVMITAAVAAVLWSRIGSPPSSKEARQAWLAQTQIVAVACWAVLDAGALSGLLGYFLTGTTSALIATLVVYEGLMALFSPGRLGSG